MGQLLNRREPTCGAQVDLADLNLIEAQRSRAIIEVDVEGGRQRYQSVILQVDIGAGSMLIDEFFPAGFIGPVGQALKVTVRRIDGSRVSFATHIVERNRRDEVDNYRVKLPASIDYKQRREVFRLNVAHDTRARSEFRTGDSQFCAALVQDVSATGIRLELQNDIEVAAGDVLANLDFEFAGQRFQCGADIRHVYRDRHGGTAIGVAFRDFPRPQQRVLERIIMQQQRQSVRHARGLGSDQRADG